MAERGPDSSLSVADRPTTEWRSASDHRSRARRHGFTAVDVRMAAWLEPVRWPLSDMPSRASLPLLPDLGTGVPAGWIRPLYRPGQFAAEAFMRDICPTNSRDVEFDFRSYRHRRLQSSTSHEMDAMTSGPFRSWVTTLTATGVRTVTVTGFLLTSCVQATASSLARRARGSLVTEVPTSSAGRRSGRHRDGSVARSLAELDAAGIQTPCGSAFLPMRPSGWADGGRS